ncbi:MAG: hypothetical protein AMXMBFR64_47050 [Myxococcales bacterium]
MNETIEELRRHLKEAGSVRIVNGEMVAVDPAHAAPHASAGKPSQHAPDGKAPAGVSMKDHEWGGACIDASESKCDFASLVEV